MDAIMSVCRLKSGFPSLKVIASGGISNGIDGAKALAAGADFAGAARTILQTLAGGGTKAVIGLLDQWEWELKGVMFLTGSRSIADLQKRLLYPRLYDKNEI